MLVKKYYFISIDGSDSNSNNLFMLFKFNLLALFDRKYQQVMGSNSVYGSNQYFGLKFFLKKLNTSRPPTVIHVRKRKFSNFCRVLAGAEPHAAHGFFHAALSKTLLRAYF